MTTTTATTAKITAEQLVGLPGLVHGVTVTVTIDPETGRLVGDGGDAGSVWLTLDQAAAAVRSLAPLFHGEWLRLESVAHNLARVTRGLSWADGRADHLEAVSAAREAQYQAYRRYAAACI